MSVVECGDLTQYSDTMITEILVIRLSPTTVECSGNILVIELPGQFDVDHAHAITASTWDSPGVARVDAFWRRVEVTLALAEVGRRRGDIGCMFDRLCIGDLDTWQGIQLIDQLRRC